MFVARAAALLALLGAAAPAAAENLRRLATGATVKPAGPKDDDYGSELCSPVLNVVVGVIIQTTEIDCAGAGEIFAESDTQVEQYVVNKNGKGKYTCHANGINYELLAPALGVTQGPIKLSGLELKETCLELLPGIGCPCNPGDPESYDYTIQVTPSGNAQMMCKFQLPEPMI